MYSQNVSALREEKLKLNKVLTVRLCLCVGCVEWDLCPSICYDAKVHCRDFQHFCQANLQNMGWKFSLNLNIWRRFTLGFYIVLRCLAGLQGKNVIFPRLIYPAALITTSRVICVWSTRKLPLFYIYIHIWWYKQLSHNIRHKKNRGAPHSWKKKQQWWDISKEEEKWNKQKHLKRTPAQHYNMVMTNDDSW